VTAGRPIKIVANSGLVMSGKKDLPEGGAVLSALSGRKRLAECAAGFDRIVRSAAVLRGDGQDPYRNRMRNCASENRRLRDDIRRDSVSSLKAMRSRQLQLRLLQPLQPPASQAPANDAARRSPHRDRRSQLQPASSVAEFALISLVMVYVN